MAGELTERDVLEVLRRQSEQIEQLQVENTRLRKRIEALERKGKKYVAPHSREVRKADAQPSGRRAGVGTFTYKVPPEPESVQAVIQVAPPNSCAKCGYTGELLFKRMDKAWITDLAPEQAMQVTAYHVPVMVCPVCGQSVRGQHADLASDQCGATAHRYGARLEAVIQTLRHEQGIPERRLPRVLHLTTGIRVTQGAINQAAMRLAEDGGPLAVQVEALAAELRAAAYVHHDDTGWRMNASPAWISTFRSEDSVLFRVNRKHGNAELRAVLGNAFAGTLVTDRFKVYDSRLLDGVQQQKCLAHLIRNADQTAEQAKQRPGRGELYGQRLAQLTCCRFHRGCLERGFGPKLGCESKRSTFQTTLF